MAGSRRVRSPNAITERRRFLRATPNEFQSYVLERSSSSGIAAAIPLPGHEHHTPRNHDAESQSEQHPWHVAVGRPDQRPLAPRVDAWDSMMRLRDRGISVSAQGGSQFLNPSGLPDTPKLGMSCLLIEGRDEVYRLACMELRGGNHLAAYSAELPGLAGWVSWHSLPPSPPGGGGYLLLALRL